MKRSIFLSLLALLFALPSDIAARGGGGGGGGHGGGGGGGGHGFAGGGGAGRSFAGGGGGRSFAGGAGFAGRGAGFGGRSFAGAGFGAGRGAAFAGRGALAAGRFGPGGRGAFAGRWGGGRWGGRWGGWNRSNWGRWGRWGGGFGRWRFGYPWGWWVSTGYPAFVTSEYYTEPVFVDCNSQCQSECVQNGYSPNACKYRCAAYCAQQAGYNFDDAGSTVGLSSMGY